MTQSPPSGQDAPLRTEFGSVTAPPAGSRETGNRTSNESANDTVARGDAQWGPSAQHTSQSVAGSSAGAAPNRSAGAPPSGGQSSGTQTGAPGSTNGRPGGQPAFDPRSTSALPAGAPSYAPPQGAPVVPGAAGTTGATGPLGANAGRSATAPAPAGRTPRSNRARGPRRARLQLRHVNPWTVLKFSCVLSIALFFVWLIVVGILFGVLDAAGVIGKLNDAYIQVNPGAQAPIRAGIVFGGAAIIGAVNIVLFIALSTVGAVVYNLCADLVGGVEITLSER